MVGSANLNIMIKAARNAGRLLAKDFREVEHLQVSMKSAADFVSRADTAADAALKEELTAARPTYGWLGQEGDETPGKDPTRRWIVDPLNGTTNYLHGMPHWAVSVALEHKGEIVAGVVFDPSKDELFFAEQGQGAWINESRLRVSNRANLIDSVFATGLPFAGHGDLPEALQDLARLLPQCAGVLSWGASALDLVYVAAGRYDGYWERGLNSWDISAGIIIAREAGALVEAVFRGKKILDEGTLIAAAEPVFDRLAKVIRNN